MDTRIHGNQDIFGKDVIDAVHKFEFLHKEALRTNVLIALARAMSEFLTSFRRRLNVGMCRTVSLLCMIAPTKSERIAEISATQLASLRNLVIFVIRRNLAVTTYS